MNNEHSLIVTLSCEKTLSRYPTELMVKGLHVRTSGSIHGSGSSSRWGAQIERGCQKGNMVSHKNDNEIFNFDVISKMQFWYQVYRHAFFQISLPHPVQRNLCGDREGPGHGLCVTRWQAGCEVRRTDLRRSLRWNRPGRMKASNVQQVPPMMAIRLAKFGIITTTRPELPTSSRRSTFCRGEEC